MPQAIWNNTVIAETDTFETVEGNVYFPIESIDCLYFELSDYHTTCSWKGVASYYHVLVEGKRNENAAWFYPDPKPAASNIKGAVAFWRGVTVE